MITLLTAYHLIAQLTSLKVLEYFQDSQDPYEDIDMITPEKVSGGSSSIVEASKKKHWWECTVDDYSDVDVDPPSPLDAQTKSSKTNLGI